MNYITKTLTLMFLISALVWGQNALNINYPGYTVLIPATLRGVADAGLVPLVAAKIDALPKKAEQSRFGILFRDDAKNLASVTVLEILDATSGKVIRRISLDEYFGKEDAHWKLLADESKVSDQDITSVFLSSGKEGDLKCMREISLADDEAYPKGKKLTVSLSLQSAVAKQIKVRFYGKVEGSVAQFSNAFSITNDEPLTSLKPSLLFSITEGIPTKFELTKKGKQQNFILTTSGAGLTPNQATKVFSISITGTTIQFNKYVGRQVENVRNYVTSQKGTPAIAIETVSNKKTIHPGDTVAYTIYYHNIGTAPATEINITGQIPKGASYVDGGTEQGNNVTMSLVRKEIKPNTQAEVTSVSWIDKEKINSGEERWVRYKVLVK